MFLVVHIPIPIGCMACILFLIDSNIQTGLDVFTLAMFKELKPKVCKVPCPRSPCDMADFTSTDIPLFHGTVLFSTIVPVIFIIKH